MRFEYQARNREGKIENGIIEASSEEAVLDILQKYGFYPTSIKELPTSVWNQGIKLFRKKISSREVIDFSRQLSIMISGGVTLLESLRSIGQQIENSAFKEVILRISQDVEGGMLFSGALTRWPNIFNKFYISIIKVGESSGELSNSLNYIADYLEREYDFNSKVKGAMIYPALVVVLAFGIILMMNFFLIPTMSQTLISMGKELPILTKIVIAIADFFQAWWWFLFLILIILGYSIYEYIKTPNGKRNFDNLCLRIPGLGSFLKKIYISNFSESLSTLIGGGVSLLDSLDLVKETVGNVIYQEAISDFIEGVKKGELLSSTLIKHPDLFPPMAQQMIMVGERTGSLGDSLKTVANFYKKETDRGLDNLLSLLEPILMVFLGVVVGVVVAAVLLPLYQMVSL
ncbi:MAG TPA: type II secretion system F family protein [Candidatus Pacearchaeota archaeon]|nr:type II secretion system F family protein [Candidatus Pacearchaeota archaeon]HOK94378.1 type II secretion system F family protein [Candidatus Pacearchaeota archaeon]HPO75308.1 type II secretion system F family protein [Candidatus Pacearchaeota archaeon]